ncbi:class I SAM-dependent methyltransferase [Actinoplanes sp. NBRC 103695]|uniref:SAM-dependent methyltransferase n=1 Tax=Actinoplanes sp. NBRC 103695 TaxID=3032202 RepID=UPI0024A54660|nr:class I SAM-dependent methyltransferase [Actinoplanes sp. NBRC 103695]GLY97277.1 hypothetical protein Acsp02_45310 [Actinoplanes sp. NBRC 103695]
MRPGDTRAAGPALTEIEALRLDAEQAALILGGLDTGFLVRCVVPITVPDLAEATALDFSQTGHLCTALQAIGVLEEENGRYRLTRHYAALLTEGSDLHALNVLHGSAVRQRLFTTMFWPAEAGPTAFWHLDRADQQALASSVSVDPFAPYARSAVEGLIEGIPPWREAFGSGARYLELGCGLSGMLLTSASIYPGLHGVGVDLSASLIDIARARAVALGLERRLTFTVVDAAAFTDPEPFDVVLWSQDFFPAAGRKSVLANAYSRLRPGGLLVAPVLVPMSRPHDIKSALDTLLLQSWDVPSMTGAEVAAEVEAAGFTDATIHPRPFHTVVFAHRP